jgi:ParB-like nuclease domain
MLMTGSGLVDAERAFARAARERRVAALLDRFRGKPRALAVHDERALRARPERGVREIPLAAITATVEPTRASLFDRAFRPAGAARTRWQRLWLAEHRGAVLPPISVVRVGDSYAVLDGHHRVSVAKARGACTIDATVTAA